MEQFICGLFLSLISLFSGLCCIPPLQQSIEYKDKPTAIFSIVCMIGMIVLSIALFLKALGVF